MQVAHSPISRSFFFCTVRGFIFPIQTHPPTHRVCEEEEEDLRAHAVSCSAVTRQGRRWERHTHTHTHSVNAAVLLVRPRFDGGKKALDREENAAGAAELYGFRLCKEFICMTFCAPLVYSLTRGVKLSFHLPHTSNRSQRGILFEKSWSAKRNVCDIGQGRGILQIMDNRLVSQPVFNTPSGPLSHIIRQTCLGAYPYVPSDAHTWPSIHLILLFLF